MGQPFDMDTDTLTPAPRPRDRNRRPPLAKQGPGAKPTARSKVSNGHALFSQAIVDGRSGWSRRMRDLRAYYVDHLNGEENTTIAERSIARRVAVLETELEWIEQKFALAPEGPSPDQLTLYTSTTNCLRRLLESIGIKKDPTRSRDVTPIETLMEQYSDSDKIAAEAEPR
jgi:hypothetical protein